MGCVHVTEGNGLCGAVVVHITVEEEVIRGSEGCKRLENVRLRKVAVCKACCTRKGLTCTSIAAGGGAVFVTSGLEWLVVLNACFDVWSWWVRGTTMDGQRYSLTFGKEVDKKGKSKVEANMEYGISGRLYGKPTHVNLSLFSHSNSTPAKKSINLRTFT